VTTVGSGAQSRVAPAPTTTSNLHRAGADPRPGWTIVAPALRTASAAPVPTRTSRASTSPPSGPPAPWTMCTRAFPVGRSTIGHAWVQRIRGRPASRSAATVAVAVSPARPAGGTAAGPGPPAAVAVSPARPAGGTAAGPGPPAAVAVSP